MRLPASLTRHLLRWTAIAAAAVGVGVGSSYLSLEASHNSAQAQVESRGEQSLFAASNPRLQALPATSTDGITFAQFTDRRPLDLSRAGGRVGFVWGGSAHSALAVGSHYQSLDRDPNRAHTAEWYAQNAPDRVVYECDRKTPAALFTYSWGYYVPLDTSNPIVRQYLLNNYILPALESGEKVIALDNVNLRNTGKRCGVFRNGQWVQLYGGGGEDPPYAAAVLDWVAWLAAQVHAHGGLLALNAKVDPDNVADTRKLIDFGDIWLDEAAFTEDCKHRASDREWAVKMQVSQWGAAHMPWVSLDKSCASPADISDDEAAWIVGNFLLAEGPQSFLGVFHDGDPPMTLHYPPSLNPPVGRPQGAAFALPGGGMARRFSSGLVVVNPSSSAPLDYTVPSGHWSTLSGATVGSHVTLPPTSGVILLAR